MANIDKIQNTTASQRTGKLGPGEARTILVRFIRQSMKFTGSEQRVLMLILDRTISYGKLSEIIPRKHFYSGIRRADGKLHSYGCGLCETTIKLAIHTLAASGAFRRTKTKYGTRFVINPDWDIGELAAMWVPAKIHPLEPARLKPVPQDEFQPAKVTTLKPLISKGSRACAHDSGDSQKKVLLLPSKPAEKAPTHKKEKYHPRTLEQVWREAFFQHYPTEEYFRWRDRDKFAFAQAMDRGVPPKDAREFVTYCVENFRDVVSNRFRWMRSAPLLPDVTFVSRRVAEFYQQYHDEKDPNRKVRHRILNAEKVVSDPPTAELKELRSELAKLKQENNVNKAALRRIGDQAVQRRNFVSQLIANRPTYDSEFGRFEDAPRTQPPAPELRPKKRLVLKRGPGALKA